MIRSTHSFTDGNGKTWNVELVVDQAAIALALANKARRNDRDRVTALDGGIIAEVTPA